MINKLTNKQNKDLQKARETFLSDLRMYWSTRQILGDTTAIRKLVSLVANYLKEDYKLIKIRARVERLHNKEEIRKIKQ